MKSKENNNTVGISFGALALPLAEQLKKQGWKFNDEAIEQFQGRLEAIHRLRFSDLLTDSVTDKIFIKLHKQIVAHVAKENGRKVIN